MNTRRQTVWLVSMLGLMVVLSAYYLFTDEVDQVPVTTEEAADQVVVEGIGMMDPTAAQQQISIEQIATVEEGSTTEGAAGEGEDAAATTEDAAATESAEGAAAPETGTADGEAANGETTAEAEETVTDEQVIEQIANRSGADAITAMQIQRDSDFSRQIEELTNAITSEEATEQQIAEAVNKQNALMDLESKLIAFEEKLLADYANVAVMYDSKKEHFTVHVLAPELAKSEAVSIVTEAMNDLNVAIHQISVKHYN